MKNFKNMRLVCDENHTEVLLRTIYVAQIGNMGVTGSTCLHVPAGYAGISRWRHNMPTAVCRAGFLFVCRAFSPAWCHFHHLSVVPGALLRRANMHPDPDRDHFLLITRYCFILCKELITPNSYLCIYNKNVARLSGIVARLTATTAFLSRMCR